jgi:PAS domain S-box-containing protein
LQRPEEVMQTAARLLGELLGVNRCAYAHVLDDQDTFDLIGDWCDGVPSIVGRYRFTDFGQKVYELMRADQPYVNDDVDRDPRTAGTDLAAYRLTKIQAVICVPLHKDGRFVAGMAVHQAVPRRWTQQEVELVTTVVDRCWETLQRMRVNEQVAGVSRQLGLALAATGLGTWQWDPATDLLAFSDTAADIYGVPRGARMTRTQMRERVHPEDREAAADASQRALQDRTLYHHEYRVPRAGGGQRWVLVQGMGIYTPDGALAGVHGVVQDVTQRREEQERAANEARTLEVLNRTGEALAAELDLDALLQRVTDAATELTGAGFGAFFYNGTDAQGEAYLLYTLSGAPREKFEKLGHPRPTALFGPTFRGEPSIRVDDIRQDPRYGQWGPHHGMPEGHLPVVSYLAVPVISRTGEVIGGLFFGHDQPAMFTERSQRLAEGIAGQAAIAIDNARLYAQAQQLAAERKQLLESERAARREAERASSLKDEFLATLSHELRTPLSAILGWVHILRRKLAGAGPDLAKGVDVIERSTRVQVQLIDDLLDMSRITSGKLRLEPQPVAPITFVQAAADIIRPTAEASGVGLVLALEAVPAVMGDTGRLQQCVWNLLANAVKFTPQGGEVRVSLRSQGGFARITVADTGAGIPPEFLPHLFERFRQADGSITRRFGGLGLGLSIVRHLAELHGGNVHAFSEGEGKGATFTLSLPLLQDQASASMLRAPMGATAAEPPDLRGARLLVVDDEADARDLLRRLLEECGAQVRLCADAPAALAAVEAEPPDLVLSDIGMPGMDGYEMLRRLRKLPPERGGLVPAIALTAFARPEDRARALEAGFAAHVAKPMEPAEVLATVKRLLPSSR